MLKKSNGFVLIALIALLIATLACGPAAAAQPANADTAEAEPTAIAENTEADEPAEAETQDVNPEQPTPIPAEPTAQPEQADDEPADEEPVQPEPPTCNYDAAFVTDVTILDGTQIESGTAFAKTWTLENTGCALWDDTVNAVHVGGDLAAGTGGLFNAPVSSAQQADLTVNFVAPVTLGDYTATYMLQNGDGELFGETFYVTITVVPKETIIVIPGDDDPIQDLCTYGAQVITNEPNFVTEGAVAYTATLEVKNDGTCDWQPGFKLVTVAGNPILQQNVNLVAEENLAASGQTVTLELAGSAMPTPGVYFITVQFEDQNGNAVGNAFDIELTVVKELIIITP